MKTQIEELRNKIDILEQFSKAFSVPEGFTGMVDCQPYAFTWIHGDEKKLAEAGEAFGKDGWTCAPDSGYYTWRKTLLDVEIILYYVSKKPAELVRPVAPTEFPLLIADAETIS